MARSSAAPFSSPWKSPAAPATPFSPSSAADKKTVCLFDWWLIEAERGFEGRRLAVSGFTTRQHAARIFSSAPIIKRHDAYTLEAADGVTVIVQGMINKLRTQDNGFPLEVCNYFSIGFPYNWDHYADEYLKKRSTSSTPANPDESSNDPTDGTGSTFPLHLDEFSIFKVLNFLTSTGDNLTTNFSGHLKNFFMSTSVDSKIQKLSSLPMDGLGKHDMDKNDGNIIGSAISVEHRAEGHTASCSKQVECSRNDLNEGNAYGITVSKRETVSTQKKSSCTNPRAMETGNHFVSFILVNHDGIAYAQDSVEGKIDAEDRNNLVDEGINNILNSPLLKGSDATHLNHGQNLGDDAAGRLHCSDQSVLDNTNVTDCLLIPIGLDTKDADSSKGKIDATVENSLNFDVIGSWKEARAYQEESVRTGCMEGELGGLECFKIPKHHCTRNVEESSSDEINGLFHSISEKIKNCNIPSVGNPTAQIHSTVDIRLTRESEVDMCSQKEPLVKVIGNQERKKDNIQKQSQDFTECIGQEAYMHFSNSAAKGPLAEEKLTGASTSPGTEEQLSTVKGHNHPSVSGICTRSGRILSSPAIVSRSEGSKDKSVSLSKMKVKRVSENYEVVSNRLETSKNKPNNLNFEEKELTLTSKDHAFVKYDIKNASTCNPAQDHAIVSENCTFVSSTEELSADHLKCSWQLSSVSSCATTKVLKKQNGFAIDHIAMDNNSHENGSPKNSIKGATQPDIPVMVHSSKDKSLEMSGKKLMERMNNQDQKEPEASVPEESNKSKGLHTSRTRKMLRQTSYVHQSPPTRDEAKTLSMASPEYLNLRRSRSGRLIVPRLDNGCQQIIYDADGSITGIMGVNLLSSPSQGNKLESAKRRRIL